MKPFTQISPQCKIELEKKGVHTCKNGSHLIKWVTLEKMGRIWKNGSYLQKWVKLGKKLAFSTTGHTRRKGHTWKEVNNWNNGSHLEKWIKRKKMGHTC